MDGRVNPKKKLVCKAFEKRTFTKKKKNETSPFLFRWDIESKSRPTRFCIYPQIEKIHPAKRSYPLHNDQPPTHFIQSAGWPADRTKVVINRFDLHFHRVIVLKWRWSYIQPPSSTSRVRSLKQRNSHFLSTTLNPCGEGL